MYLLQEPWCKVYPVNFVFLLLLLCLSFSSSNGKLQMKLIYSLVQEKLLSRAQVHQGLLVEFPDANTSSWPCQGMGIEMRSPFLSPQCQAGLTYTRNLERVVCHVDAGTSSAHVWGHLSLQFSLSCRLIMVGGMEALRAHTTF